MKATYFYSRKIRVPVPDDKYNAHDYTHGKGLELDEFSFEDFIQSQDTNFSNKVFDALAENIDKVQRDVVKKEMGLDEIPIDSYKTATEIKRKFIDKPPKQVEKPSLSGSTNIKSRLEALKQKRKG